MSSSLKNDAMAGHPDELFNIAPGIARRIRQSCHILQADRLIDRFQRQVVLFLCAQGESQTGEATLQRAAIVTRLLISRSKGELSFDSRSCHQDKIWQRVQQAFGVPLDLSSIQSISTEVETGDLARSVVKRHGQLKAWLVVASGRVYLQRDWSLQVELVRQVQRLSPSDRGFSDHRIEHGDESCPDGIVLSGEQLQAVSRLSNAQFSLLSGGPGTGKTTVIARVLSRVFAERASAGHDMNACLVAPTGKAVARLSDSLQTHCSESVLERAQLSTIHRLLGWQSQSRQFRHNRRNRLSLDLLICDEASMVDLELMVALLDALPDDCRVILVGDENQLASIEPGHVFRQLWQSAGDGPVVTERLSENFRFSSKSGIARLSNLLVSVNTDAVSTSIQELTAPDFTWRDLPNVSAAELTRLVPEQMLRVFAEQDCDGMLAEINRFRMLCPVHHGPLGVDAMNRVMNDLVRENSQQKGYNHPHARVVMVTRNDYRLGLFNGDQGIWMVDEQGHDVVVFELRGERRSLPAGQISALTDAWAMTVHKAQGSEYEQVVLLLDERDIGLLTRELIYTAITRARQHVTLVASKPVLGQLAQLPSASASEFHLALGTDTIARHEEV